MKSNNQLFKYTFHCDYGDWVHFSNVIASNPGEAVVKLKQLTEGKYKIVAVDEIPLDNHITKH